VTITGPDLHQTAREAAEELRGTTSGRPFVEKLNVYKVAGKVFLIVTDDPDEPIITVKADPDRGHALRSEHPTITPGRYLDKRHWISVGPGPQITAELVRELVTLSYDDVLDNVPRDQRP
jgi:predicted DNA-binding protein (MmcQ/YjbR family)